MIEPRPAVHAFALLGSGLGAIPGLVARAMRHPAVGGYQISFGPPLVRANARLKDALPAARSPFEKLELYFQHCLLDPKERVRLTWLHRALVTQRLGPLEAEEVAERYADALELSLTLRAETPAQPVDQSGEIAPRVGPEGRSGRFLLRFDDLPNERLLSLPEVAARAPKADPFALELRVSALAVPQFRALLATLEDVPVVDLGDPTALARVRRDGAAK